MLLGGHVWFQAFKTAAVTSTQGESMVICLCTDSRIVCGCVCVCAGGWMAWSLWSVCDNAGLQVRSRVCGAQGSVPCVGNSTEHRDCNEIPGESDTPSSSLSSSSSLCNMDTH